MLEAVEIEHHHDDPLAVLPARNGVVEPVLEQSPVRQSGQHVVEGQMMGLSLARLQLENGSFQCGHGLLQTPHQCDEQKEDDGGGNGGRRPDIPEKMISRQFRIPDEIADEIAHVGPDRHRYLT
ncbi:MAG: hypothetical protein ACJ8DB_06085 [Microvirga sp.]